MRRRLSHSLATFLALLTTALAAPGAHAAQPVLADRLAAEAPRANPKVLALAARAIGEGHFEVDLPDSRIAEVATVAARFDEMRQALQARLVELRDSNEALQDRSARLVALQSDLLQRERLAAAGRLVAQLVRGTTPELDLAPYSISRF